MKDSSTHLYSGNALLRGHVPQPDAPIVTARHETGVAAAERYSPNRLRVPFEHPEGGAGGGVEHTHDTLFPARGKQLAVAAPLGGVSGGHVTLLSKEQNARETHAVSRNMDTTCLSVRCGMRLSKKLPAQTTANVHTPTLNATQPSRRSARISPEAGHRRALSAPT
jgi:hypothetical protein